MTALTGLTPAERRRKCLETYKLREERVTSE